MERSCEECGGGKKVCSEGVAEWDNSLEGMGDPS